MAYVRELKERVSSDELKGSAAAKKTSRAAGTLLALLAGSIKALSRLYQGSIKALLRLY